MTIDLDKYPLDQEMIAFLDKSASFYPEANGKLSVKQNRKLYLQMCTAFNQAYPRGISTTNETIQGRSGNIPIRRYQSENSDSDVQVIYLHGGGFVIGNLDSHDSICAELADQSGYTVVAVDYRLAPEHVHPAALEDALDVFLSIDRGRTIIVGDSAGGTLTCSICIAQQHTFKRPLAQVLIYPWLGGELLDLPSYNSNGDAPGLTVQDLADYHSLRSAGESGLQDPLYYPLALSDYSNMPPCVAFAAEFDPLCDDAGEYVSRLQAAGIPAENHVESGLIHGYLRARHMAEKAERSFHKICQAVRRMGQLAD